MDDEAMDMCDIMEVVAMFRCKFCAATFPTPAEMGTHVTQVHALKVRGGNEVEVHVESEINPGLLLEGAQLIEEQGEMLCKQEEDQTSVGVNTAEQTTATSDLPQQLMEVDGPKEEEVFLCGQCNKDFSTMEECKLHMEQDHNLLVSSTEVSTLPLDEVTAVYVGENKVSVGIQANTYRKPGRKPKNKVTPKNANTESGENKELETESSKAVATSDVNQTHKEEIQQVSSDDELEESDEDKDDIPRDFILETNREQEGKRRTRLPKALLEDYYVGKKRYKQKKIIEPIKQEETKVKCDVIGCNAKFKSQESLNIHKNCHLSTIEGDQTNETNTFVSEPNIAPTTRALIQGSSQIIMQQTVNQTDTKTHTGTALYQGSESDTVVPTQASSDTEEPESGSHSFSCYQCKTMFFDWQSCRSHLWKEHEIDVDMYKCRQCKFRADTSSKLKVHERSHSKNRPYECSVCGKGFHQAMLLHSHELQHEQNLTDKKGNKQRICHICEKEFANPKTLKTHIEIIHSKVRPFSCPHCDYTCARKAMMENHIRTHTREKPFKCDLCDYATSDHNTLRRHRYRHTGVKPYSCKHCPYSCIQAISLKTHMDNKHPGMEGVFACDQCQYRSINKKSYESHMKDHRLGLIPSFNDDNPPPPKRKIISNRTKSIPQAKPVSNYFQIVKNGKSISVPFVQVPQSSSSSSSDHQQLLYQALTAAGVHQQQQQTGEEINQATHTIEGESKTITFQIPAPNSSSSQSLDSAGQEVIYSMEQADGTYQEISPQTILEMQGSEPTQIVYMQTADDNCIDSTGLQHIITAIQNTEGEGPSQEGSVTINLKVESSDEGAGQSSENVEMKESFQIQSNLAQNFNEGDSFVVSGEQGNVGQIVKVINPSGGEYEGQSVTVYTESGESMMLDLQQLADAGMVQNNGQTVILNNS